MNISEIKKALPVLLKHKVVPYLHGQQGIGKTQVVRQTAKENDLDFIHLHLATQDVGDLVGLLVHNNDGTVKHARPEWFPTQGKGIVFLDEVNRAHPDVLQAMFSFVTEGTIHTHKLPKGWSIVAAGNYQSNMFNTTEFSDAAWMSRFCHIDFQPTKEEFVLFAEDKKAFSVASFIRNQPEMLQVQHKERLNTSMITPDPRSYLDMISKLEEESSIESMRYEIYSGIIGPTAAAAFLTHKTKESERLSGKQVLFDYQNVKEKVLEASNKKTVRFDFLNTAVEEILSFIPGKTLEKEHIKNLKSFLLDIPCEMSLKAVQALHGIGWNQKNDILNSKEFAQTFKARKLRG